MMVLADFGPFGPNTTAAQIERIKATIERVNRELARLEREADWRTRGKQHTGGCADA